MVRDISNTKSGDPTIGYFNEIEIIDNGDIKDLIIETLTATTSSHGHIREWGH